MKTEYRTIYIVEDSKTISEILKKLISTVEGTYTEDFQSGEDMLRRVREQIPDFVFLDYALDPRREGYMDGEETFKRLRHLYPEIPVIMITGVTNEDKLARLQSVGFNEIIHKDHDDLFNQVLNCVRRHAAR